MLHWCFWCFSPYKLRFLIISPVLKELVNVKELKNSKKYVLVQKNEKQIWYQACLNRLIFPAENQPKPVEIIDSRIKIISLFAKKNIAGEQNDLKMFHLRSKIQHFLTLLKLVKIHHPRTNLLRPILHYNCEVCSLEGIRNDSFNNVCLFQLIFGWKNQPVQTGLISYLFCVSFYILFCYFLWFY